ncbi:MAG: hypothetical protein QG670_2664 [Thermoproteota archaeon]|nr:hypothetical protein [Thermoproteota archaeon]
MSDEDIISEMIQNQIELTRFKSKAFRGIEKIALSIRKDREKA